MGCWGDKLLTMFNHGSAKLFSPGNIRGVDTIITYYVMWYIIGNPSSHMCIVLCSHNAHIVLSILWYCHGNGICIIKNNPNSPLHICKWCTTFCKNIVWAPGMPCWLPWGLSIVRGVHCVFRSGRHHPYAEGSGITGSDTVHTLSCSYSTIRTHRC